MGLTADLSRFTAGLRLDALPPDVVGRAKLLALDLVGSIVRARYDAESSPALLSAARALGLAAGSSGVFGDSARYTPAGAAFLNGALGHSLDFDDTHAASSLHPGAPVIPAALAAGEMAGASGADVLAAIVAGYEVVIRTALALPAKAHYDRGFHPTATCGAFGAAAAASRVFGLDPASTESALGVALSQAAGSLQFLANGAWTKRFQVGWAAMAGLTAATLAREGLRGAAEALEGQHGFLRAYAPDPRPELALAGLGEHFELMRTAVKPYPSCRYGHACIDAALELRAAPGFDVERLEEGVLGLPRAGLLLVGEPVAKRSDPRNTVDAQFSGPFVVASALLTGRMDWDSYKRLDDPGIRRLLPLLRSEHDEGAEREFPANMAGRLTLRAGGQTVSRFVAVPKGEPDNFVTEHELRAKFDGLAVPILGETRAGQLAERVLALDTLADVAVLMRVTGPVCAARLAGD